MSTTSSAAAGGSCPTPGKQVASRMKSVRAVANLEQRSSSKKATRARFEPDCEAATCATSTFHVSRGSRARVLASQKTVNNLMSFSQTGALNMEFDSKEEERAEYKRAYANVKRQIHKLGRTTISPQSKFLGRWDFATATAMLWTAFVTPFQIGFLEPIESPSSALSILNRLVDVVFLADMAITFFVPYRESPHRGGMWTFDNKKIAKRYLTSWFPLDLFTSVPLDLIMIASAPAISSSDESGDLGDISFLRLVRVFRVAKLARLLRASRIYHRWIDHIGISFAFASLIRFLVMTCVLAHWLACLWGYTGQRATATSKPTWHSRLPESFQSFTYGSGQYRHALDLYGVCIYVSLTNIFGGATEIYPVAAHEYFVQAGMMLCGSCVWAYVIGSCCGILATLNPALLEYRQQLDELNVFLREHEMPQDIRVRLRGYFRNTLPIIRLRRYDALLSKMSTRLRGDTSLVVAKHTFKSVSYLSHPDLEPEFLSHVTTRMKVAIYSRLESINIVCLFIVDRGVVAKQGKICLVGACLGDDMIVASQWLRNTTMAIALTFTQAVLLSRESLFELLPEFPNAYRVVRRAAYLFALRRYIVTAAETMRTQQEEALRAQQEESENTSQAGSKPSKSWSHMKAFSKVASISQVNQAVPTMNDTLAAMREKQKEVEDNLSKASRASAMLLAPVEISPFQGESRFGSRRPNHKESNSSDAAQSELSNEVVAKMARQDAALESLKQQVGGVDAKLDALQKQMVALTVAARQKTFASRQKMGISRSRLPDANTLSHVEAAGAPAAAPAARAEELQELRDAEGKLQDLQQQGDRATRSTPFEA